MLDIKGSPQEELSCALAHEAVPGGPCRFFSGISRTLEAMSLELQPGEAKARSCKLCETLYSAKLHLCRFRYLFIFHFLLSRRSSMIIMMIMMMKKKSRRRRTRNPGSFLTDSFFKFAFQMPIGRDVGGGGGLACDSKLRNFFPHQCRYCSHTPRVCGLPL